MSQTPGNRLRAPWRRSPRQERGSRPTSGWSLLREVVGVLVTAILVSMLVKTVLVQAFFIPSGSMEPTLHGCPGCTGDRVLVNKLTGRMGGVQRGDVVVFHDSYGWLAQGHPTAAGAQSRVQDALVFIGLAPTTSETDLIKRVIGVGGDTVEGRDGKTFVNGFELTEPYVFPGNSPSEINFKVTVPPDNLWVMGDHRSESEDSRFHQDGPGKGFIQVKDVVGRAFVIVWPLGRVGSLTRPATFDQSFVSATH